MFKTTLSEVNLLKDPISSMAEIIDEGLFKVTKEGISFVASDRAMVSVVDFFISSSAFEKYEIDNDQMIGLNVANLLSVIKRAGNGDKITLEVVDSKLQIFIEGSSKRKFMVPMLEIREEEIPPVDKLEFASKVELKSDVLQNGVSDAEIIGDSVILGTSPTKFLMTAEGDLNRAELELSKGDDSLLDISSSGDSKSRYALDYLKKMVKASKLSDSVIVEHGTDYPLRLVFKSGDKVRLSYILAPRVTDE